MKILITRTIPQPSFEKLISALPQADIIYHDHNQPMPTALLHQQIHQCDGILCLLTEHIDQQTFRAAGPSLKVVSTMSVGFNHIDIDYAQQHSIRVCHTPDVLTDATADLTMALILGLSRKVLAGDRLVRSGSWQGWDPMLLLGLELRGKTLGIVGMGRIGQAVAQRASAFGMRIQYTSNSPKELSFFSRKPLFVDLHELCSTSDIISLHCPLQPDTHHLFNTTTLDLMQSHSLLINTARGPIIDEIALSRALCHGHIAGAALDVYENEPQIHPELLQAPNTLLLPHLGSSTQATREAMGNLAVDNLIAVLQGRPPRAQVC